MDEISRFVARLRSLWRGVWGRATVEEEMRAEFRLHQDLRAQDHMRAGVPPEEAIRRAKLEFGSTEQFKDLSLESRGLRNIDAIRFSALDFKLGFRMLVRYPGLALVGGFALAFAIWVGAGTFEFLNQVVNPTLPLPDGDRIVALRNWDAERGSIEHRSLHDFLTWRNELQSVTELGVWRDLERNLIHGDGQGEPVPVAEISATAFRVARVQAFMGRTLLAADEAPEAVPVAVIGYDLWQNRFNRDPSIVGRTIKLGTEVSTVVGVMPKGFAFPVAHDLWIPFGANPLRFERREGPSIQIFGRLAPGASMDAAQVELTRLGQRTAADHPETHKHLRPQVLAFPKLVFDVKGWASVGILSSNLFMVMLVALICANIALLMFARAATRENELVVRTALGASRIRIITQLFAESLVLAGIACVIGLAAASYGLEWAYRTAGSVLLEDPRLPFWFQPRLSPSTVGYAILLATIAALLTGVLPALKITHGVGMRLRKAAAVGGGMRFGGIWTAIIVTQVAVTTTFPVVAFAVRRDAVRIERYDLGFPAQQYLAARLEMDREPAAELDDTSAEAFAARFVESVGALERQLLASPTVRGVTYVDHLPRSYHGWNQIEVDEGSIAPPDARGHMVSVASIETNYFDVLGTPLVQGRPFNSSDIASEAKVIIVNKPFVERVLGGKNAIGRRVRYVSGESRYATTGPERPPWYEIIGVAPDLGTTNGFGRKGIYHALPTDARHGSHLIVKVMGDARSFVPEVRAAATAVDPTLRLHRVMPVSGAADDELKFYSFWLRITVAVSGIALVLSLCVIYAVVAFTVSRRTREIGVRVALGADRRSIVTVILRRPMLQVALGVVVGAVLVALLLLAIQGQMQVQRLGLVGVYAVAVTAVCMAACIVPMRRALRVQPTEALREDV